MGGLIVTGAAALFFCVVLAASAAVAETAEANTGGCYGPDCTGKDPTGLCDGDAYTVASKAINTHHGYAGQLELRYSPSCAANWGRFTIAHGPRELLRLAVGLPDPIYGRVTVWNPGEPSEERVNLDRTSPQDLSQWTNMVDGTKTACTGVEVLYSEGDPYVMKKPESTGWIWGPCV